MQIKSRALLPTTSFIHSLVVVVVISSDDVEDERESGSLVQNGGDLEGGDKCGRIRGNGRQQFGVLLAVKDLVEEEVEEV